MSIRKIKLTVWDRIIGHGITWTYKCDNGRRYEIPIYQVSIDGVDNKGAKQNYWFGAYRFGVTRMSSKASPSVVGLADQQTHIIKQWIPTYKVHSYPSTEDGAWQVYGNFLIHDGPDDPVNQHYATIGCVEICQGPNGFNLFNDIIINLSGSKKPTRNQQLLEIGASGQMSITYMKVTRPPLKVTGGLYSIPNPCED